MANRFVSLVRASIVGFLVGLLRLLYSMSQWKSSNGKRRDQFEALVRDKPDLFDEGLINSLAARSLDNDSVGWKATAAQMLLMLFLPANLYDVHINVKVFDDEIGSFLPIREVLLLLSSLVGLLMWSVNRQRNFINDFISSYLLIRYPVGHSIRRSALKTGLFEAPDMEFDPKAIGSHWARSIAMCLAALVFLLGTACLIFLMASVHFLILWKMWTKPAIPAFFNHLIIMTVICFDLFSVSAFIVDQAPLPLKALRTK
jgi:hypothetical protein